MSVLGKSFRAFLFVLLTCFASNALSEEVTLNLKDADIRALIETVSKATGKQFIIDPRVKAKVTVVSPKPMEGDELYEIFLSILQVHGFSAIPTGGVIKIVPDINAKQGPVPIDSSGTSQPRDQLVTRVIQVNHVPAAQLVPILRPLIPQQGQLAAYQPSNVLLISDRAANVSRIVGIISRIDKDDNSEIELIRLDHASAQDVAQTISSLLRTDAKGVALPGQPSVTADLRTNSILLSGDQASRLRLRGLIAHLDIPLDTGGDTQVVFLKYSNAEEMVKILTGVSQKRAASESAGGGGEGAAAPANVATSHRNVDIQADTENNALIITAPPAVQQELKSVIAQLDIRRSQVLLEAIIAEVSLDLANELGVQFGVNGGSSERAAPVGGTNFNANGSSLLGVAQGVASQNLSSLGTGLLLGLADTRDGKTNFGLLLKALANDSASNVLSTPTLVTLDNKEAEIVVGENVPFLTGSFSNTGASEGASNPFQTIERKDVGLTLKVKPQINEGSAINMEIEQESSSVSNAAGAVDLITRKRTIKTNLLAEDGQIVVMGGLMSDRFNDTEEKVPGLGDIPVLGNLFKYNSSTKSKTTLMMFIRPVILDNPEKANLYTQRKYRQLQSEQIKAEIEKRGLFNSKATIFPDLDELITVLPEFDEPMITQFPESQLAQ